jgi:LacI family transcriptional regulator
MSLNQVSDRLTGARRAAAEAGLGDDRIIVIETPALNVAEGRAAGVRIAQLAKSKRPTAVFCANDLLALGVLQEMTRVRANVPGDLAIVGYDDIDFAAAAAVPLTSVRQPRSQLGDAATKLLIDEVANPDAHTHRQVVFEPELVIRESTVQSAH